MANSQNQVPAQLEPIGSFGAADVPVTVKPVWYKFFVSLSGIVQNIVGGVLGFTVQNPVVAAGTTQGTATKLTAEWSVVTTVPANSGVKLKNFGAGVPQRVFNKGANALNIYPPEGLQIDALGANNPYPLAAGKMQEFSETSTTQYQSMQLG